MAKQTAITDEIKENCLPTLHIGYCLSYYLKRKQDRNAVHTSMPNIG